MSTHDLKHYRKKIQEWLPILKVTKTHHMSEGREAECDLEEEEKIRTVSWRGSKKGKYGAGECEGLFRGQPLRSTSQAS